MKKKKRVVGWTEYVDFPDWKIKRLKTKIDTGAKTSALDVCDVKRLAAGKVSFRLILSKNKKKKSKPVVAKIRKIAKVKSSPLHHEKRIFVNANIKIGSVIKKIELNLVDRSKMIYRMLLGRTALKGDFVVDVDHTNLLTKKRKTKPERGKKLR